MNSDFCVAVHAMVYLNHKREVCSSEELAQNICTHPARVRRILVKLRKKLLLDAVEEGPRGGYRFSGDPDGTTMADIAAALEVAFVAPNWRSGDGDMDCLISSGMGPLMDGVFGDLNGRCYARLKEITVSDLDRQLFQGKKAKEKKDEIG